MLNFIIVIGSKNLSSHFLRTMEEFAKVFWPHSHLYMWISFSAEQKQNTLETLHDYLRYEAFLDINTLFSLLIVQWVTCWEIGV